MTGLRDHYLAIVAGQGPPRDGATMATELAANAGLWAVVLPWRDTSEPAELVAFAGGTLGCDTLWLLTTAADAPALVLLCDGWGATRVEAWDGRGGPLLERDPDPALPVVLRVSWAVAP